MLPANISIDSICFTSSDIFIPLPADRLFTGLRLSVPLSSCLMRRENSIKNRIKTLHSDYLLALLIGCEPKDCPSLDSHHDLIDRLTLPMTTIQPITSAVDVCYLNTVCFKICCSAGLFSILFLGIVVRIPSVTLSTNCWSYFSRVCEPTVTSFFLIITVTKMNWILKRQGGKMELEKRVFVSF